MLGKLFAPLAAKIMVGVILALLTSNVGGCVIKNAQYSKLEGQFARANKRIEQLSRDVGTLKSNQASLEGGLAQCNAGAQATADAKSAIAAAGVTALQQVQRAGKSIDAKVRAIDTLPKETCEDALNILKTTN